MNRRPSQTPRRSDINTGRFRTTSPEAFLDRVPGDARRGAPLARGFLFLLLALVLFNLLVNRMVVVREVEVRVFGLDPALDGYTILQLSDLKGARFGPGQSRLAHALQGKDYDVVVCTGDMVSPLGNAQPFYELLERLDEASSADIYYIPGDTDPVPVSMDHASSGSPYAPWVLGATQRGARLLSSPVRLAEGNPSIWLTAASELTLDLAAQQTRFAEMKSQAEAQGDAAESDLAAYQLARITGMQQARKEMAPSDLCIALTHVPPADEYVARLRSPSGAPLTLLLAGHWLGGLSRLPLLGPLFVPDGRLDRYGLFPGDYGRLRLVGTTKVYDSPGLGRREERYPPFFFRTFNPPSVTLLRLRVSSF